MGKQRVNKFLRDAGIGSRRKVESLILEGRVAVNGMITQDLSTQIDAEEVTVDGKPVHPIKTFVYYKFNKPKGYLCSHARRPGEQLIYDLLPEGVFSIGRLDKDTTGLLLITNDGTFANKVIHPSSNVVKVYHVKTLEEVSATHLKRLREGTTVEEVFVQPTLVEKTGPCTLSVSITEGKKREVRVLVEKALLTLLTLKRVQIGGLPLGELPEGTWAPLTEVERKQILLD